MDDMPPLPELTRRQEDLLSLIIRTYSENPEPVSSKYLVEKKAIDFSSATVRNEMARLEEMGYISAPHTSAGRVPTLQGYRYFVRGLMNQQDALTPTERKHIGQKITTAPSMLDQWMRQIATLLARTASTASLITAPNSDANRFKHVELIAIQGRLALMVLVLQGGIVHQRMLNLADSIPQNVLSDTATRINALCDNLGIAQMRLKRLSLNALEREIVEIAIELMDRPANQQITTVYQDGLSEIVKSFTDNEGTQQAIRIIQEPAFLDLIVKEIFDPQTNTELQVIVGGGGRFEELSHLSVILSRYGVKGQVSGTLGVLGPTHINYDKAIRTVRLVTDMVNERLNDLYDTPTADSPPISNDFSNEEED